MTTADMTTRSIPLRARVRNNLVPFGFTVTTMVLFAVFFL